MRTPRLQVVQNPADRTQHGLRWLSTADDSIVICRSQGHNWPRLRPGKARRGIRAVPWRDGSVEIVFTCGECSTERSLVTKPGGVYDPDARYTYSYPEGYSAPKGSELNRRDAFAEVYRRTSEELLAGVRETSGQPESAASVPLPNFQAGG